MTVMTFSSFKEEGQRQHFPQVHFSNGGIPINGFQSKTTLFSQKRKVRKQNLNANVCHWGCSDTRDTH